MKVVFLFVLLCWAPSIFSQLTRISTSEPIFQDLRSAAVDSSNIGYFASYSNPALLHQVNLNSMKVLESTNLQGPYARSLVIDDPGRKLYIGFGTNPGYILKWSLEKWASEANLTTFHNARTILLDRPRNILYVATYPPLKGQTSVVHKINATTMRVLDTLELPTGFRATTMVHDTSRNYLFIGSDASPATIIRVWAEPNLQQSDVLVFPKEWNQVSTSVIDSNNQFAYFGISQPVGRIAKIDLGSFSWVDTISTGGAAFSVAAIDNTRGFSYWVTNEVPSVIYRVRLCDFQLLDLESLNPPDLIPKAIVHRPLTGVLTLGTSCVTSTPCKEACNSIINLQANDQGVCADAPAVEEQTNLHHTFVNLNFANMVPKPTCCPPPDFFAPPPTC